MIERFRKELHRAISHGLNPHPGISVSSDEDDWDIAFLILKPGLQFQTRHLRHKDVSDHASQRDDANRMRGILPLIQSTAPRAQSTRLSPVGSFASIHRHR